MNHMKKTTALLLALAICVAPLTVIAQKTAKPELTQLQSPRDKKIGIVIHGGAGVISRGSLTPEREKEYRAKLEEALLAGYKLLEQGRSSLDAIEAAIRIMVDSPLFNAGKGAVFTNEGKNELDASVMDGKTLGAVSVAGLRKIKNPITLARTVMEKSPHVMMVGQGAEKFAVEQGFELVDEKYFFTEQRWEGLQRVLKEEQQKGKSPGHSSELPASRKDENRFGTVGAVALDKDGNLAAGTSTGGMTNKRFGRVGDAPIIGAGTYANNATCAVSATGWGEYFIRLGVARDISALMEYRALPVQQAADIVIKQKLQNMGADGGVIVIDKFGNIGISFNSEGMYRAYMNVDGKPVVQIYKD